MRVLVCGDRNWTEYKCILARLQSLPPDTVVIHGGCRGADQLARQAAQALGFQTIEFPARWKRYGRAAGPIRNKQMLCEGKPDLVLAFHHNLGKSRGTADTVRRARTAGLPVEVLGGGADSELGVPAGVPLI